MPVSKTKMSPSSFGKLLYADLKFLQQLLGVMDPSLIASSSEHFA